MTTTHDDDTMLDEEWLAAPTKRSRLTAAIAATLVASVFFLGGSLTQKHLGADDTATGAGGLPSGMPEGFGGGAFPGGDLRGAAQEGTGTESAETEAGGGTDAEEQVIGTVIEKNGNVWLVEDLGGKRHEVTVDDDTEVTRESMLTPSEVEAGDRVQVSGVERNDRLRAADITLR